MAAISELLLISTLLLGHAPYWVGLTTTAHVFFGLGSALLAILTHCLVFAIFTGSGKDAREVTEDLFLRPHFVKETKRFRRENFSIALYGILALLVVVILGGALGSSGSQVIRVMHLAAAWLAIAYNGRIFWKESIAVRENSRLIETLNSEAAQISSKNENQDSDVPLLSQTKEHLEWTNHVHALGRFLCFLGYNVWLPYLYLRFIMGYLYLPLWPFIALFSLLLLGGIYLRWSYRPLRKELASH